MNDKYIIFFFFQAEDGIRDLYVTGVQTCALPIWRPGRAGTAAAHPAARRAGGGGHRGRRGAGRRRDRKSTRLNSSHVEISYAVFCLKKKKSDRTGQRRDAE